MTQNGCRGALTLLMHGDLGRNDSAGFTCKAYTTRHIWIRQVGLATNYYLPALLICWGAFWWRFWSVRLFPILHFYYFRSCFTLLASASALMVINNVKNWCILWAPYLFACFLAMERWTVYTHLAVHPSDGICISSLKRSRCHIFRARLLAHYCPSLISWTHWDPHLIDNFSSHRKVNLHNHWRFANKPLPV